MLTVNSLGKDGTTMYISDDCITTIIAHAVMQVRGVSSLAAVQTEKGNKTAEPVGPISVKYESRGMKIRVAVNVESTVSIPEVAEKIQHAVKDTVQSMTEKPVDNVDVAVEEMSK